MTAALRLVPLLALLAGSLGCIRKTPEAPYPHESLLSMLAELKIALRADPWSHPPGRDLEGQNIYRVTLARLDGVDSAAGEEYNDIISFARAECHERLGDWGSAVSEFGKTIIAETSLGAAARERRDWAVKVYDALNLTTGSQTLSGYVNTLEFQRREFNSLLETDPPFPYDCFIRVELEHNLREHALFLFQNRLVLPQGAERAIESANLLVEEHDRSRRRGENFLLQGQIFEGLARDYAERVSPDGSTFDLDLWGQWMSRAREAYRRAAQADGDPAKPEGQSRLRALDAYSARIANMAN